MGCSPTALRMNSIPSNNVKTSSKSTRSTVKNSASIMSPQKLDFDQLIESDAYQTQRYYSPKYTPKITINQVNRIPLTGKTKNLSKQKVKQKPQKTQQNKNTQNLDIISHLSLNSQFNSKQNMKISNYQALIPQKQQNMFARANNPKNKYSNEKQALEVKKQKFRSPYRNKIRQGLKRSQILEKQLKNINTQKFQRIDIKKMHF